MKKFYLLNNKVFFIIIFIICCFNSGCSKPELIESIVIEKQYIPSQTSTGVGITTSGKTVITTQSSSEQYIVFVSENDEPVSIECDAKIYFKINKGSYIKYWKKWHGRYIYEY
jgi:hypothetical protein